MLKKIVLSLLIPLFLSGCSVNKDVQEITFSSWGSISEVQILKKLISDFESENPGTKINFQHIPQNYFQKLHLLFASNTAPDVIFINNLYLPLYAEQLKDLSKDVDKKEYYNQALEALSYDNKNLAIPRDVSILLLYINNDFIFNEPQNIDDLLNISLALRKKNVFGISFEEDVFFLTPYLSYFNEVFNDMFDSDSSKGLSFYLDLRDKYFVAPSKSQIGSLTPAQMFIDRKIAMYLSGRWMYPKIKESASFNWSVIPFPFGEAPQICDASGWAISKNTKNEDLAIKFVKFLSKDKSIEYFTETGLIIPAKKKCAEKLNNKEHNEYNFLKVVENSKNIQVSKNYKKLVDEFNSKSF